MFLAGCQFACPLYWSTIPVSLSVLTVNLSLSVSLFLFASLLDSAYCSVGMCLSILVVVQLPSSVGLFVTSWTAACQASLSLTTSQSLPKFMSIVSVMPSNQLILCCPRLLLPSIFPSTKVFSSESALCIRWLNYWSFSFSISPSNEYSGLISFRIDFPFLFPVHSAPAMQTSLLSGCTEHSSASGPLHL